MIPCRTAVGLGAILTLGILFCRPIVAQTQQVNEPRKVALLVGVNKYTSRNFDDLSYAERDVEDVGTELKKLGFNVVVLRGSAEGELKATREQIDKQLLRLLDGIGKRDLVFVMFSGHGQQLERTDGSKKEDSFFCPVDAIKDDAKRLFSVSYLIDEVLANRGGRNVVLIDACRDEPKDASRGSKGVQGRRIALPEETAVFFSCRAGQRSFESERAGGGHGLFTYCLLDGMRNGMQGSALTWNSLVNHVDNMMASDEVAKLIPQGGQQEPLPAGNIGRLVLARTVNPDADRGWTPLFDGKDLSGWTIDNNGKTGPADKWTVKRGAIVASGDDYRTRSYLLTDREYSDFMLRLEFSLAKGATSAIALRASLNEKVPIGDRQIFDHPIVKLIETPSRDRAGRSETTGTTHWLEDRIYVEPNRIAEMEPADSWNRLEIEVRGRRIRAWLNEKQIIDSTVGPDALLSGGVLPGLNRPKGYVGLQKHTKTVRFRKIEIKNLAAAPEQ